MIDNNIRGKKYRNRRIGDFLKELKLTEGRNTGIPKIKRALKNNGSPEPIFETDEDRTYFITTILIHEGFKTTQETAIETTKETTIETTKEKINTTQLKIIHLMNKNPSITIKEIATELNITKDGIWYNINTLKKHGIISREGSTKNGKWLINLDIFSNETIRAMKNVILDK